MDFENIAHFRSLSGGIETGLLEEILEKLKETISEHEKSYSIGWCLKSEFYISRTKKTVFGGGGRVFLSKENDFIAMSGSGSDDWEEWFELEMDGLEIYWVLEIIYDKRKIAILKFVLNISTLEILKMKDENGKIYVEKEVWDLEELKKILDQKGVVNILKKKRRPITNKK